MQSFIAPAKAKGQKMALGDFLTNECMLRFTQPILETLQRLTSYSFGLLGGRNGRHANAL